MKQEYIDLIEIAEDAQMQKGCANPDALRRHCKAYTYWKDCEKALSLEEQNAAIDTGFKNVEEARDRADLSMGSLGEPQN